MSIYNIVNVATIIIDIIITLMFFGEFLTWKQNEKLQKTSCSVFMFIVTLISNHFIKDSVPRTCISIVMLLFASFCFNNPFRRKVLVVCGYMAVYMACDIITALLMMAFLNTDANTLLNIEGGERMIAMILSKPILLCLVKIVSLFKNNKEADLYTKYWIALFTVPIINIILLFSIIRFFDNVQINNVAPVYISAVCILYSTVIVFFLFDKIMGITLLKNKCTQLENQVIFQAKQVKKDDEINKRNESIRHDIKLHFQLIYDFLKSGHSQNAVSYMEDLGIVRNVNFQEIHTGNLALDATVNAKLSEAKDKSITTQIICQVPSDLKMKEADICSLFGNLLDNAIEGCECSKQAEQSINIILQYKLNRLNCYMQNTARDDIIIEGDSFKSNKDNKDEHGIGIYNIKNIVLKYNGICEMSCKNNLFTTSISLFDV